MNATDVAALLEALLVDAGIDDGFKRADIRVWKQSGVERVTFSGGRSGTSVVFKYAHEPFDAEDTALRAAEAAGLPVPHLIAALHDGDVLGMLMEDLGDPQRDADDADGVQAAVRLHRVTQAPGLDELGERSLVALPSRILDHLRHLGLGEPFMAAAQALTVCAVARSQGAGTAPYGLVHSEFHPTSLHIGATGLRVVDLARAFIGPGLIDLASWHGTMQAPDVDGTGDFLTAYVAAGGAPDALKPRGGVDAPSWALGWHRVWVAEWFLDRMRHGWAEGREEVWLDGIRRHLTDAAALLS